MTCTPSKDVPFSSHLDGGKIAPGIRRLLAGWLWSGTPVHDEDSPVPAQMPHVDTADGAVMVGSDSPPRFTFAPFAIFDRPRLYVQRMINTVTAVIPGNGSRAMFNRILPNPPANTIERFWGMQGATEVPVGNTAAFSCGVPGHGDLNGLEGTVVHAGSGIVDMAVGLMGYIFTTVAAGRIKEAISVYGFQPTAGSAGSVIDRSYCFKAKKQTGLGTLTKKFSFVSEDGCGPAGIGFDQPEAMLSINGGLNVGAVSDPGTGNVKASGYVEGAAVRLTAEGGVAVYLKNSTLATIPKGSVVKPSTAADDSIVLTATSDLDPIGVVYADILAGDHGWVVVFGRAEVLVTGNANREDWIGVSTSVAGRADPSTIPSGTTDHFRECGHTIRSRLGAGLVFAMIHFN